MKKAIQTLYKSLCTVEETLAMVGLITATVILCIGAVCRAVGSPLTSISEIALCLFAWCVFWAPILPTAEISWYMWSFL